MHACAHADDCTVDSTVYTELPHDAISAAATEGLQLFARSHPTTTQWDVHILRKTVIPCTGRAKNPPPGCLRVSTQHLLQAVTFELKHCYIVVGKQVLRQIKGAAMGGYLSPAMAQLVCIAAERSLHTSLPRQLVPQFAGFRYVDDGLVMVCYEDGSAYIDIKNSVLGAYPAGMVCEVTTEGKSIDILERHIPVEDARLPVDH